MDPYQETPSVAFDDLPGDIPGDVVPPDVDLAIFSPLTEDILAGFTKDQLTEGALWRDFFALTSRSHTFYSAVLISQTWNNLTNSRPLSDVKTQPASIARLTQNSSWVDVAFTFHITTESGLPSECFGILSFVPAEGGEGWKVYLIRTMLESFEGHGHPDDPAPIFKTPQPPNSTDPGHKYEVVILGAGQNGLSVAGRLGALGISYLLLERQPEVGWSWTGKYDTVRQHTIKEMNNLPFDRTYKDSDPTLLPGKVVKRGFQEYVEKYKINVWCVAETEGAVRKDEGWELSVQVEGRMLKILTRHLLLSIGGGVSVPSIPEIPGNDVFKGDVFHQSEFRNGKPWKGRKGVVVGTGTTAHDIAQDMLEEGLASITMIQRGKTPVIPVEWIVHGQSMVYNTSLSPSLADRLVSLIPHKIERQLMKANMNPLLASSSARFDALEACGFNVDRQPSFTDYLLIRGGGYYIDVGASKHIIDGDIKVKSGIKIDEFSKKGLVMADGELMEADVVVLATGYERDPRRQVAGIVGKEIAGALPWAIGMNEEGERRGDMRPSADKLWIMRGPVNMARFYSRFIALQIQAELLGKPLEDCQWSNKS